MRATDGMERVNPLLSSGYIRDCSNRAICHLANFRNAAPYPSRSSLKPAPRERVPPQMTRTSRSFFQLLAAVFVLISAGCSTHRQNLAELPADSMYIEAQVAFENRDWDLASRLLEFFVSEYIAHPEAPNARMMLGDVSIARREYAIAATHYQRLLQDFPSNPRALEARFKICDAYVKLSPRPQLDQEFTYAALQHCESVAQNFPGTTEGQQAAAYVIELTEKLARKAYDNGFFYFRRGAYDAAIVYFQQVLAEYPFSEMAPTALARLIETFERIGYVEDAAEARERLLRDYPDSEEAREIAA